MNKEIEALLVERAGYLKRNLDERVEAVDEALKGLGFDLKKIKKESKIETASVEPEVETSVLKRGKRKKA